MYQQRIEHYEPNHLELKLTSEFIAHQVKTAPMTWVSASDQHLWNMDEPGVVFTQGSFSESGQFVAYFCTYSISDLSQVYPSIGHVLRLLQSVCTEENMSAALAEWLIEGTKTYLTGSNMELPDLVLAA